MEDNSKYLKAPQEQFFWKALAFPLQVFAIGNCEWWGFPPQPKFTIVLKYITLIFGPVSFMSQILYFYLHCRDYTFMYLGNLFTVIMVTFIAVVKLIIARKAVYRKVMKEFLKEIHIYYYKPKDAFVEQTLIQVGKYNRWIARVTLTAVCLDNLFWMMTPIVNNIINGAFHSNGTVKLQTCIYMVMPFDFEHNLRNWVVMHIINVYVAGFGCTLFAISDTILLCIVTHLIARIKILHNNLKDIAENFDTYSEMGVYEKLRICIRDHIVILRSFKDMQGAFGLSVTGYYAFNLIFDALLILELKYGDMSAKVAYIMMVIIYIGGLFGLSYVMEEVRNQGDDLPNAVYDMPWERMSLRNRKVVLIFLARVQPILVYKAFAGLEAGIKPAINIIKTSVSYYVMLKSLSDGEF